MAVDGFIRSSSIRHFSGIKIREVIGMIVLVIREHVSHHLVICTDDVPWSKHILVYKLAKGSHNLELAFLSHRYNMYVRGIFIQVLTHKKQGSNL